MASNARRRAKPALEHLESRQLLHGNLVLGPGGHYFNNERDLEKYLVQQVNIKNGSTVADRRIVFQTAEGGKGTITLYGQGTLKGTKFDPVANVLDIIYDDTNSSSKIIGKVHGGNGRVNLRMLRDADVSPSSLSSVGTNQVGVVNLGSFDLIDGGRLNLFGGVGTLYLRSIGSGTVVDVAALPLTPEQINPSPSSPSLGFTFVQAANGVELAGVGGLTVPGAGPSQAAPSLKKVPAPGVNFIVSDVNGTPREVPLANPQVFGYDPTANALVRFDAVTGGSLQTIPLTVPGAANGEVGLGRYRGRLVAAVAVNTTVEVFDAVTGAVIGSFDTSPILGGMPVDGVGLTDRNVELVSSAAQQVQIINLTASVDTGFAVPAKDAAGNNIAPFTPTREFTLAGGATGTAGLSTSYLAGAAFFDTFTPNTMTAGVLTTNTVGDTISETARTALTSPSSIITNVPGSPGFQPFAFGSVDLFPSIVTAFDPVAGTNTVSLYNPSTFGRVSTVAFQYPNRLTGLSESFHPELVGSAIVNANGIVNQFSAHNVTGLVFNDIGFLNLINVKGQATDSAFVGLPVGQVNIHARKNVQIISTTNRPNGTRGGVTLVPGLQEVGPLFQPTPPGSAT